MPSTTVALALETCAEVATTSTWAERITERYQLQDIARRWLCMDGPNLVAWKRLNGCHRLLHPTTGSTSVGVQLLGNPVNGHGCLGGLQNCASPWVCPLCSAVIWDGRKAEIAEALERHRSAGGAVLFITLTASHHHLPLASMLDACSAARRQVYTGGAFTRFKSRTGYLGAICATEITWSHNNGWHPHYHILWLLETLTPAIVQQVQTYLETAWLEALREVGLSADVRHGVQVKESSWAIEEYIAKMGHDRRWDVDAELTMGTRKVARQEGGLSAMELLRAGLVATSAQVSKAMAERLFIEYASATRHHHSLRWSPGLREKLGMGAEKTDEELAQSEGDGEQEQLPEETQLINYGKLPAVEWRKILANDCRAELRVAVGKCDRAHLVVFLQSLGIEWEPLGKPPERSIFGVVSTQKRPPAVCTQLQYPTMEWSYPWFVPEDSVGTEPPGAS